MERRHNGRAFELSSFRAFERRRLAEDIWPSRNRVYVCYFTIVIHIHRKIIHFDRRNFRQNILEPKKNFIDTKLYERVHFLGSK